MCLKVDVDQLKPTAKKYNVEAFPTFIFFKNGKETDRLEGADENQLRALMAKVNKTASSSSSSDSSTGGQKLGGTDPTKPKEHPLLSKLVTGNTTSNPSIPSTTSSTTSASSSVKGSGDADPVFLQQLTEMGFDPEHAASALKATKNKSLMDALDGSKRIPSQEVKLWEAQPPLQQPQPPRNPQTPQKNPKNLLLHRWTSINPPQRQLQRIQLLRRPQQPRPPMSSKFLTNTMPCATFA